MSEPTFECVDCGVDAWAQNEDGRLVHEDFYVHDEMWDAVCPDDEVVEWEASGTTFRQGRFLICIGCFERRLGRRLERRDFAAPPHRLFPHPPSNRFLSRWNSAG